MYASTNRARFAGRILVLVLGLVAPAFGHHSFTAEFDQNKPIKLTGKITEMKWSNPHGWIYVDVTGPDGKVVNWAIEASTPNQLYRAGWRKTDLPVGSMVTLADTSPARNGSSKASGGKLTLPDGRKVMSGYAGNEGENQ